MAGSLTPREKLLHKRDRVPHRYHRRRALTQALSLLVLFGVPVSGLARVDLWSGAHLALGRRVELFEGLAAIAVGMAALYLVTFAANSFVGRMFCGWGCPVAQISRFGEEVEIAAQLRGGRWRSYLKGGLFGVAVSAAALLWWVDPRVLIEGSALAVASTLVVLAVLVAVTFVHGRFLRWRFCQQACPIGLYYSVVALARSRGIVFDQRQTACKQCRACELICPVGLDPRDLGRTRAGLGGLAIDGLPSDNHCLRCGDCVQICEYVFRDARALPLPLGFRMGVNGEPLDVAERRAAPAGAHGSGPTAVAESE